MSVRRIDDRSLYRGHALPAATGLAGTAHGPAVDLKPRAGAATGGYLMIDQPEANAIMDEMERENAINPITMERPELRASVFRVEARTPKPDGSPRYSYWDPAELWRWLRQPERQGRMPDTNEPIWFEDWWALYYTYGAPFVPDWAYSLEKRDRNTRASASVVQQMMAPGQANTFTPSDGRLQALSRRNRHAARAARPRGCVCARRKYLTFLASAVARKYPHALNIHSRLYNLRRTPSLRAQDASIEPSFSGPRASARCRFASSSATACLSHAARTTARSTSSTFTFSFRRCFAVKCATPKASSHMALRCSYGAMLLCLLSNACVYTGSTHTSSNIRRKCDTIVACPPSPVGGLAESP